MGVYFDFGDRRGIENTMRTTWCEFRDALANRNFRYSEVDKAKATTFLKVYDDLFCQNGGIQFLTKQLKDIQHMPLGRGSKLEVDEPVSFERFLPKKEFIKSDNRFSPAGVEWLYLALGDCMDDAFFCSKEECRASDGQRFGFCAFNMEPNYIDSKVVDLTLAEGTSYCEINEILETYARRKIQNGIKIAKQTGVVPRIDSEEFARVFTLWAVYTYTRLLSKEIFVPIYTDNKDLEYAPFQTLAQYFISLGFHGIIYSSTVSNRGKNIVLFDKHMAKPCGKIRDAILPYSY